MCLPKNSALNHPHRFVSSALYDLPYFKDNQRPLGAHLTGRRELLGTLTFESGEDVTVLSGNDSNQNGDSAGDLAQSSIRLAPLTLASTVTALKENRWSRLWRTWPPIPNAPVHRGGKWRSVQMPDANTFRSPAIQNLDFSIFKNFAITETKRRFQLGFDFLNAFNHPQYTPLARSIPSIRSLLRL